MLFHSYFNYHCWLRSFVRSEQVLMCSITAICHNALTHNGFRCCIAYTCCAHACETHVRIHNIQELSSASTRLLYDLLRDPVLAQSDIKQKEVALGFAKLTQWTAMTSGDSDNTYGTMIARYRNLQDSTLRYCRVRAIERYGSSALYISTVMLITTVLHFIYVKSHAAAV
jgi:hypothetical protein